MKGGEKMNKKGIAESGVIATLIALLAVAGSKGLLYSSSCVSNVAGSNFFVTTTLLSAYSQMPHVKRTFREKRANEICKFYNKECVDFKAMPDNDLLAYIRDDENNYEFYQAKYSTQEKKSGGKLRAQILGN
jgi:hypothetical protein